MLAIAEKSVLDFYMYPSVGGDDWRYVFETAQVRAFEMQMLSKSALLDMANADGFKEAIELLGSTEYALPQGGGDFAEVEDMLLSRRTATRRFFEGLMLDRPIVELFRARDDFANLRLAVRRVVTDRPVGADYSADGNVRPEIFERVFAEESYELFPDYMQAAAEQSILAYYQNKEIRRIDYAIDASVAQYYLRQAHKLENIFLLNLFRLQTDLTNIITMLRLKFTESEQRNLFLQGGFIDTERLQAGLDSDYESLGQLFFVTPYHRLVEEGAGYLTANKSFLALEGLCEQYLRGFLKSTIVITSGPQPIIAYLLMKEDEIRKVRFILTAKKNMLDTKLILDRIG
jgi:V/A-type H+-transporting ATPase subunit C